MAKLQVRGGERPSEELRAGVEALVREVGQVIAAEKLQIARMTLQRIVKGRVVRRGTLALVALKLRDRAAQ